jgi:hypothetical protein
MKRSLRREEGGRSANALRHTQRGPIVKSASVNCKYSTPSFFEASVDLRVSVVLLRKYAEFSM